MSVPQTYKLILTLIEVRAVRRSARSVLAQGAGRTFHSFTVHGDGCDAVYGRDGLFPLDLRDESFQHTLEGIRFRGFANVFGSFGSIGMRRRGNGWAEDSHREAQLADAAIVGEGEVGALTFRRCHRGRGECGYIQDGEQ